MDIKLSSKEIVPENDAKYWLNLALNNSTSSLIQSLAALNSIIQGLNTLNGISIVGVYSNNVKATETEGSKHKLRTLSAPRIIILGAGYTQFKDNSKNEGLFLISYD